MYLPTFELACGMLCYETSKRNSRSRRRVPLVLNTTQVVKCVCLEGEIVSTTMVTGEGTNLIDHNHQISVMLENY